jgi:Na+/H+-dicarboxylate symporter
MCRTIVNITGDAVCAVLIASTEGQLDAVPAQTEADAAQETVRTPATQ